MPQVLALASDSLGPSSFPKIASALEDLYSFPAWAACLLCTVFCCLGAYVAFLLGPTMQAREQRRPLKQGPATPPVLSSSTPLKEKHPVKVDLAATVKSAEVPITALEIPKAETVAEGQSAEHPVVQEQGRGVKMDSRDVASPVTPSGLYQTSPSEPTHKGSAVKFDSVPPAVIEIAESQEAEEPGLHSVQYSGPSFKSVNRQLLERGPLTAEVVDGEHHYVWDDNSEYYGSWQNGRASGRGTFSWPSGDKYEGEWREGLENGMGAYTAKDGSSFQGHWLNGQMHGKGVFQSGAITEAPSREVYYMRDYDQGHLVGETKLREQEQDSLRKTLRRNHHARKDEKRKAAREKMVAPLPGEIIYKGHRSYALMKSLQFGLLFSTSQGARANMNKQPSSADFKRTIRQTFPRSGDVSSFKWKDYCPLIFRRLRSIFGIDDADYMLSLTGDSKLRELPSPGKSRSVFFISGDDRFMIKTVRKEEMNLLLDLIPKYHKHCIENHDTLLTRFFGVHRIKPVTGNQVRFVVMANVFPVDTRLHRKFDLKGSTYGRTAGSKKDDPNTTLKDLDVDFKLKMEKTKHSNLMLQLEKDAKFLEKMHVMDYSLLLGMHYSEWGNSWNPVASNTMVRGESPTADEARDWPDQVTYESDDARSSMEAARPDRYRDNNAQLNGSPFSDRNGVGSAFSPSVLTSQVNTEVEPSSRNSSLTSQNTSLFGSKPGSVFSHQSRATQATGTTQSSSLPKEGHLSHLRRSSPASTIDLERPMPCVPSVFRIRELENAVDGSQNAFGSSAVQAELDSSRDCCFGSSPGAGEATYRDRSMTGVRMRPPVDRTRSGWLKDTAGSGEGLKSLKAEVIKHMGCSLPAVAYPLSPDADGPQKPEPVTLFIGIIDFLQMYNFRKRGEHIVKSIVQDGKTISVTDPKTYAERFVKHMKGIFLSAG